MVKLTKEYLSILQYLIYKAQKQYKIKQISKYQKIISKSQSIILFLFRSKSVIDFERNKLRNETFLSQFIFKRIIQIIILKKKVQIHSLCNMQLNKKLINFIENLQDYPYYNLSLNFINKQIFPIFFVFIYDRLKLSYLSLSFFNSYQNFSLLELFQYELLNIVNISIFLLLLSNPNKVNFDINNKKINILKKKSNFFNIKFLYKLFHYRRFYYFYHQNYLIDSKKIEYHNFFYFDLLSNRKQQYFFFYKIRKNNKIQGRALAWDNQLDKSSSIELKNNKLTNSSPSGDRYYSLIFNFPYFRKNYCYFSETPQLLNNFSLKNMTIIWLKKLNNIQKQILLFLFEPIWEACFEISSYSNRRGRSIYDAIEFLRLNLKQKPVFLFKTCVTFFDRVFYFLKKRYIKLPTKIQDPFLVFLYFFENILLYGIQKKYQNYYLITKQQLFLYQIMKIFTQNKKNNICFYKIFYNNKLLILSIQNKIFNKLEEKILIHNNISFNLKNIKTCIRNYKHFIIQNYKNFYSYQYEKNLTIFSEYFINNIKSKNPLMQNLLIFSLSHFFFDKIKHLKQRLFSIELKKQHFSFYLQQIFVAFIPIKNDFFQKEGISFSIIFKDSNIFVSKNTFLFFIKNKKVFFETNILNKWTNKDYCFYKKIENQYDGVNLLRNNKKFIKKLENKSNFNIIQKKRQVFICWTKKYSTQWNYKILLKINLLFFYGYYNSLNKLLDLSSFHNIFLKFIVFIKNILFLNKNIFYLKYIFIMYCLNFCGKFVSFIKYDFQHVYIIFLLEKNDVQFIWKNFIKYENQFLFFNSNFIFLESYQTIFKKSLIFNKLFLFFYLENNEIKIICNSQNQPLYRAPSFTFYYDGLNYLKHFFYLIIYKTFSMKELSSCSINQKKKRNKIIRSNKLWSIKLFMIKKKHTFLFYKQHRRGFSFFDFYIYHTNKHKKLFFSNYLFFWQFYFIAILLKLQYIKSFSNYYKIYNSINKKVLLWKYKQIRKILQFYFCQFLIFQGIYTTSWESKNKRQKIYLRTILHFLFSCEYSSLVLFRLIFSKHFNNDYLKIYDLFFHQKKLTIFYFILIQPSKYNIQKHLFEINNIVKKNYSKSQEYLIFKLSRIIKNWCFYYQILTSTMLYKYIDYLTLHILWKWSCKRHYKKSKKWIKMKYFHKYKFIYNKLEKNNFKNQLFLKKKIVFGYQTKDFLISNKQKPAEILLSIFFNKKKTKFYIIFKFFKKQFNKF